MASIIDLLQTLGGQTLTSTGQEVPLEEIVATGMRKPTIREKMAPTNVPINTVAREVPRDEGFIPPERASPLGIKGTLRNILGGLGDALLIGTGNKPTYAPKREKERLSDAYLEGYGLNPEQAEQRVAVEDPLFAYNMSKDRQDREIKEDQLESLTASREALDRYREDNLQRMKDKDAEIARYQQEMLELKKQLAEFERVKEEGRNRRDNPPAAPARVSALERIRDKVAEQGIDSLTPGQRRVYEDSLPAGKKPSRVAPSAGPAKKASGSGWGKLQVGGVPIQ